MLSRKMKGSKLSKGLSLLPFVVGIHVTNAVVELQGFFSCTIFANNVWILTKCHMISL